MSSLAADTRAAVRRHPFLFDALRAGVVNYTAASRYLARELDATETDPVVAALRRFADDLDRPDPVGGRVPVSMESGLGVAEDADALLRVGETAFAPDAGSLTGVLASGDVDPAALGAVLARLRTAEIEPVAAGAAGEGLLVVVERRDGPTALRVVEDALSVDSGGRTA